MPFDIPEWQQQLVAYVGYGDLPIHVVGSKAVRVEHLLVPGWPGSAQVLGAPRGSPGLGPDRAGDRRAVEPAARLPVPQPVQRHGRQPKSDTRRTKAEWGAALDAAFADAGCAVVHPETLPVEKQIRLAAPPDVLAGNAASALHLAVFGPPERRVVEVGDDRTPNRTGIAQTVPERPSRP